MTSWQVVIIVGFVFVTIWGSMVARVFHNRFNTRRYLADKDLERAKIPRGLFGAIPTPEQSEHARDS